MSMGVSALSCGTWYLDPEAVVLVLKRDETCFIDLYECTNRDGLVLHIFQKRGLDLCCQELADMLFALDWILCPLDPFAEPESMRDRVKRMAAITFEGLLRRKSHNVEGVLDDYLQRRWSS